MPKKAAKGAFFFFLLDYKKRCERNGERFEAGIRDEELKGLAGEEWKVMRPEQKRHYEDLAKEEKARVKGNPEYKETNLHTSFASIDRQKEEEEEEKAKMNSWIEHAVSSLPTKYHLANQKFYLMHVNFFCIHNEVYHPAELAIAEFSLAEGVSNVFHRIIEPGSFPLGLYHEAKLKSDVVHKIPLQDNGGEKDFYKMYIEIKKFLQPGIVKGEFPPLFTMHDNVSLNTSMLCVKSIFKTLTEMADESLSTFRVYTLDKLFFELKNACSRQAGGCEFPLMSFALIELEKDAFNYTSHIACNFHVQEDFVQNCSKSFVQRWAYLICDHCCKDIEIELIPGRHVPLNADVNFKATARKLETQQEPKKFTWIDHSKPNTSYRFIPEEQQPLPQPRVKPNLAAMRDRSEIDHSELSFPMMSLGRGRGAGDRAPRGRGSAPMSFAAAMKK